MRIVWLVLVGLTAYLVGLAVFFPVAPLVDRVRPQLGPVALEGVNGRLYKGMIDSVRSTDDLLPLQLSNVGWTLAPASVIKGGAGANLSFDAYGGEGEAHVMRRWNGDIDVSDFTFNAQAKLLEPLLPVPIASFSGELSGDIASIRLVDQLLTRLDGTLRWDNAQLESPVPTALGDVVVQITPEGEQTHRITLTSQGGDVAMDGAATLTLSGDFTTDILFTPADSAPQDVRNGLRQMGREDNQGRVRLVRQGNVNNLM